MEEMKRMLSDIQSEVKDIKAKLEKVERKAINGEYTYTEKSEKYKK